MDGDLKYLKAWLINLILAIIISLVAGVIIGAIFGFILGLAGVDRSVITILSGIIGFLIGLYSMFFSYKWSIKKFIIPQLSENR
jgi:hypothetical protein